MISNVVATIYEMVEDSQQRPLSSNSNSTSSTDSFTYHQLQTSVSPNKLDHVIIARLSSSVLLQRDYSSAVFKRSTFNLDSTVTTTTTSYENYYKNDNNLDFLYFTNKPTHLSKYQNQKELHEY